MRHAHARTHTCTTPAPTRAPRLHLHPHPHACNTHTCATPAPTPVPTRVQRPHVRHAHSYVRTHSCATPAPIPTLPLLPPPPQLTRDGVRVDGGVVAGEQEPQRPQPVVDGHRDEALCHARTHGAVKKGGGGVTAPRTHHSRPASCRRTAGRRQTRPAHVRCTGADELGIGMRSWDMQRAPQAHRASASP
jgi:hypothetical protein